MLKKTFTNSSQRKRIDALEKEINANQGQEEEALQASKTEDVSDLEPQEKDND